MACKGMLAGVEDFSSLASLVKSSGSSSEKILGISGVIRGGELIWCSLEDVAGYKTRACFGDVATSARHCTVIGVESGMVEDELLTVTTGFAYHLEGA